MWGSNERFYNQQNSVNIQNESSNINKNLQMRSQKLKDAIHKCNIVMPEISDIISSYADINLNGDVNKLCELLAQQSNNELKIELDDTTTMAIIWRPTKTEFKNKQYWLVMYTKEVNSDGSITTITETPDIKRRFGIDSILTFNEKSNKMWWSHFVLPGEENKPAQLKMPKGLRIGLQDFDPISNESTQTFVLDRPDGTSIVGHEHKKFENVFDGFGFMSRKKAMITWTYKLHKADKTVVDILDEPEVFTNVRKVRESNDAYIAWQRTCEQEINDGNEYHTKYATIFGEKLKKLLDKLI